jgi:hypothetical protein
LSSPASSIPTIIPGTGFYPLKQAAWGTFHTIDEWTWDSAGWSTRHEADTNGLAVGVATVEALEGVEGVSFVEEDDIGGACGTVGAVVDHANLCGRSNALEQLLARV